MRIFILIALLMTAFSVYAGDLDDGIKIDEPNNDNIDLDINIQYIKRRAKAAAEATKNGDDVSKKIIVNKGCSGTGNQNFGAGANLKGATIVNLSENKGTSTVCGQ